MYCEEHHNHIDKFKQQIQYIMLSGTRNLLKYYIFSLI